MNPYLDGAKVGLIIPSVNTTTYRSYEAVMSRGVVRAARAAAHEGFDNDVALHDAREVSADMIVSASALGPRLTVEAG